MFLPNAQPADIDLDPTRLQFAYDLLAQWTTGPDAPLPGAALLAGRHGKTVSVRHFGKQGPEPEADPIREDGIFLLASITKPVTYLAAMTLVERGELLLSDPVAAYIPEFAAHHKEEMLVAHLFTHTSGMPDMLENNLELRRQHAPLEKFIEGAILHAVPLFRPGTNLSYQSMGTLVVAEIVQRLTGTTIHQYVRQTIFEPLGMTATSLGSDSLDANRLVRVQTPAYQQDGDFGWNSRYWRSLGAPWGGLFSTPEDLAVLCQLMLSRGRCGDVRLISPRTVEMMTTNRLDDFPDLPESIRRTQPWGLGWQLNHLGRSGSWSDLLPAHVYGHTGATGTMLWIDPVCNGFCILLTTGLHDLNRRRLAMVSNAVASAFV